MKTDILLFTQTMHSLLSSFLPLQSALAVCREILAGKAEKKFTDTILITTYFLGIGAIGAIVVTEIIRRVR